MTPKTSDESSSTDWFSYLLGSNDDFSAPFDCGDWSGLLSPGENVTDFLPRSKVLQLTEGDIEIDYRKPLGSGAFSMVYPVHLKHPQTQEYTIGPMALKRLSATVARDEKAAKYAIKDLRQEAKILSELAHENIIDLYGESSKVQVEKAKTFLVMDILKDTLESHLETWSKSRGRFKQFSPAALVTVRLREVAFGIVQGMEYMHSKNILFRDLKPANVGFDRKGGVKLFDFGLAVKLSPGSKYRGRAGTPRYMAPEMSDEYGLPSDVYSFAILLWQIVTTRLPFESELSSSFGSDTLPKDLRPPLKYVESKDLQSLLERAWAANPDNRPTFSEIRTKLRSIADSSIVQAQSKKEVKKSKKKNGLLRRSMFNR